MGGRLGALVQRLRLLISHLRVAHSASQTAATSPPARFGSPAPGQWAGVSSSAPGGNWFWACDLSGPERWAISSRAGQGGSCGALEVHTHAAAAAALGSGNQKP